MIFKLLLTVIDWIVDDIFDSSNVTTSPWTNLFSVKYTISTSVDDTNPATCATASLVAPTIFSPNIAFVFKDKPLGRVILSKVGLLVSIDSNTPTIFTTSGQFREISLSSTLNPYPVALVMPVKEVLIPTAVLSTINFSLLIKSFCLLFNPCFLRVVLTTTFDWLVSNPLIVTVWPSLLKTNWSEVKSSIVPFE